MHKWNIRSALGPAASSAERGSVMLEFALIVGGLVLGTVLFVDSAGALVEYLRITMAVNEGTKIASRTPGLEEGEFLDIDTDSAVTSACAVSNTAGSPCGQLDVQQRVRFLVLNTTTQLDLADTTIRSTLTRDPSITPTNVVRVQINSHYRGYLLTSVPLGVVREGPYLVQQ